MKQRIYFWIFVAVVLLLLFGSCGSSHKSVKSDTEVIRKDSTSESVNIIHGSATSLRELITTNGNYVIDFRIYDTRKPPDSLTGKPPLLVDGHVEGDFSKNRKKETVVNDCTEMKTDKETTSNTREENRSETMIESNIFQAALEPLCYNGAVSADAF